MLDTVLTVAALVLGGVALWWAARLEPHWASRDGHRFTARVQVLTAGDQPEGRWREVRAAVTVDGTVMMRPRGVAAGAVRGDWRLISATVDHKRRRAVYLAVRAHDPANGRLVARIPVNSKARPVLDELVERGETPSAT